MKKDIKPGSAGQPPRSNPPAVRRRAGSKSAPGRPGVRRLPQSSDAAPARSPNVKPGLSQPAAQPAQTQAPARPSRSAAATLPVKDAEDYYHYEERYWVTDPQTGEKKVVIKRRAEPQDLKPRRSKITIDLSAGLRPRPVSARPQPENGGQPRLSQAAAPTVSLPPKRLNQLDFGEEIGLDISVAAPQGHNAPAAAQRPAMPGPGRRVTAPLPRLRPQHLEPSGGKAPAIDRSKLAARLEQQVQQQQLWKQDLKFFNDEGTLGKARSVPGFLAQPQAAEPSGAQPQAAPVPAPTAPLAKSAGQPRRSSSSNAADSGVAAKGLPETAAEVPAAAGPVHPPVSRVVGRLVNPLQQPEIKRPQVEAAPAQPAAPALTSQPHFDPIQFESLFADFNDTDEADETGATPAEAADMAASEAKALPEVKVTAPGAPPTQPARPAGPGRTPAAQADSPASALASPLAEPSEAEAAQRLQAMEAAVKQSAGQNAAQLPPREPAVSLFEGFFDEPVSAESGATEPLAADVTPPDPVPAAPAAVQPHKLAPALPQPGTVNPAAAKPAASYAPGADTADPDLPVADLPVADLPVADLPGAANPVTPEPVSVWAAAPTFVTADMPMTQPGPAGSEAREVSPTLDFTAAAATDQQVDQAEPLILGADYPPEAENQSSARPGWWQRFRALFPLRKGQAGFALLLQTAVLALLTFCFPVLEAWLTAGGPGDTGLSLVAAAGWILLTLAAGLLFPLLLTRSLYRPRERYYQGEGQTDLAALLLAFLTGFPAAVFAAALGTWLQERWPQLLALAGPLANLTAATSLPARLLQLAVLIILPAILAELLYRGLVLADLARTGHATAAVILQALIYALFPGQPGLIPVLFPLGLLLGVIRRQTDQLTPGIAAHLSINLTLVLGWPYLSARLGLQEAQTAASRYLLILAGVGLLVTVLLLVLLGHHLQQLRQPFEQDYAEAKDQNAGRQRLYYVAYDENSPAHQKELWESETKQQGFFYSFPLTLLALLLQFLIIIW
ncbi:MAG: CPBP family glutamic-type intramembrane protease [Oscillospiraceae bacterium]|nr:CPBP family glutamic-type intramembrane protease [Oscillospiraceae bacterium]